MAKPSNDYKLLMELVKDAKEQAEFQRTFIADDLEARGFDVEKLEKWVTDNPETTVSTVEEAKAVLNEILSEPETTLDIQGVDFVGMVNEGIEAMHGIMSTEEEIADIEKESKKSIHEYVEYLASPEYEEKRLAQIEEWKERLKTEESSIKRAELEKRIRVGESHYTLSFMFDRLNNEKTFVKERQSMMDGFFDVHKSTYLMERFSAKCAQASINPNLYTYFFGIEEKFLEEKYHVYNNFFLMTCMRYVAHADMYNEMVEVKSVINALANLIYGRFVNGEVREVFLNTIRTFLDKFEDKHEYFEEKNILHPKHPHRIMKDAQREKKARESLYGRMMKEGIVQEITEEITNMSIDELTAFVSAKIEEKEAHTELCKEILYLATVKENVPDFPENLDDMTNESLEELREHLKGLLDRTDLDEEYEDQDAEDDVEGDA